MECTMEVDQPHTMDVEEKKDDFRPFTLKRWNACAVWTWDVECDTCAICRLQLMEECLRCQADGPKGPERDMPAPVPPKSSRGAARVAAAGSPPPPPSSTASSSSSSSMAATAAAAGAAECCVVVWGECSHSFHNCCMSQWVKQNARCPLCQQDWVVSRIGK